MSERTRDRTSSSSSKGRRWRKSRQEGAADAASPAGASEDPSYIPPTLGALSPTSDTPSSGGEYYVTSPPKKAGLTGSISTLFRRAASREPGKRDRSLPNSPASEGGSPRGRDVKSLNSTASPGGSISLDSTAEDQRSTKQRARSGSRSRSKQRLFYSSDADGDESDDSFESRHVDDKFSYSKGNDSRSGSNAQDDQSVKTIVRYRGFSTSLKSLFLDEALVCASMGCFGLILSNRTEYLLQVRNDRRGVRWGRSHSRRTLPSRIVAYALLLTLVLIASTFVIWGFGSGRKESFADSFFDGYADNDRYANYDDDNNAHGNDDDDNDDAADADDDGDGDGDDDQYDGNGDDDYYDDAVNGDDDAAQGDDYVGDDAANGDDNANDDGNGDDNYQNDDYNNGDDNYNDDGNNDDGNGDDNYQNDDYNNGDDNYNYYKYYNWYNNDDGDDYYNDDANRRMMETNRNKELPMRCPHRTNGIFKIRDMNEGIWVPAIDFIKDEWNGYSESNGSSKRLRALEEDDDAVLEAERDLASDLRISFVFAFLVVLGILGRRRRMRTRYYLVRARAQEDHLYYASSGVGVKRVTFQDAREDQYEGACSHTLCGCYPTDPPMDGDEIDDEVEVSDEGVSKRKKRRHHEDCIARGFNCLLGACCGVLCKCWFQCLSICALAQEAREIRLLVPTRYQRLDYITHQPFHEYQKDVNDLRRGWLGKTRKKSGIMPHLNALSRLSRYILLLFFVTSVVIILSLIFNPRASFSWPDAVVLLATFGQSFIVIYLVHWIFHKSDLSLDAVIKFFAAGFIIAVPSAFFFEGLLVNITLSTAWIAYSLGEFIRGDVFVDWVIGNYKILWILGELVNAYVVAAITEELCKYYTFRCVEHPDLIFLTGLDRQTQDDRNIEGGLVKYPFGSHQVQQSNRDHDDDESTYSRSSHRSRGSSASRRKEGFGLDRNSTDEEFYEDEHDVRTHRQKAAAVTTGMISVAVGLACAENFLYVFLLGGSSDNENVDRESSGFLEEWIVLFFRSIFPVHALAAAMQSINMIRKFVECSNDNNHRVGVGRIILPAVVMHGSFDAVLLGINVYIESSWDKYLEARGGNVDEGEGPYDPLMVNIIAWLSVTCVMLVGIIWYYRENRAQRLRLILLEEQDKAKDADSDLQYTSPSELSAHRTGSEGELV